MLDKDVQLARKLAEKAEGSCMISRAIQGNVKMELHATILKAKSD